MEVRVDNNNMMGKWSDDSACWVVHDVLLLDTVVISGEDGCCSVVFGTLVGVVMFSVMWSQLLMTSTISCPLWSSMYECQRLECAGFGMSDVDCVYDGYKWSDDSACWVVHDVLLYSELDTVVISGEDVCCSVVFGTLVYVVCLVLCGLRC